jgi:hypothetical protein
MNIKSTWCIKDQDAEAYWNGGLRGGSGWGSVSDAVLFADRTSAEQIVVDGVLAAAGARCDVVELPMDF